MERERLKREFLADPDRFIDLFLELVAQNKILADRCSFLENRVAELESRLAKNSSNSSKPPSSDGLSKPLKTKSQREHSGLKPGGQPGHTGSNLRQVNKPDLIVTHKTCRCGKCGRSLHKTVVLNIARRQVFDIPPQRVEVTEHQAEEKQCVCGYITAASFPEGITQAVQYGANITAMALTLSATQFVPFGRIREFFAEVFELKMSAGTIARMISRAYHRLESFEQDAKDVLLDSAVAHSDETGAGVSGKLHWIHALCTKNVSLFLPHARRGKEAMKAFGVLLKFRGVLVHDFLRAYFAFDVLHAMCNAHILRELRFEYEEMGQQWAKSLKRILLVLKNKAEELKEPWRSPLVQRYIRTYDRIVAKGLCINQAPKPSGRRGRTKQSSARNLLERLRDHREDILRFALHAGVPFDNNLAERDIRMVKLKLKVSGCFRSQEGISAFCRIRSYAATIRKRGIGMYGAMVALANGHPLALSG